MPALLDLLGRRWSLRLVWELRRDALAFSALRERTGISPSVLCARLAELADAGVVERDAARRYRLTGRAASSPGCSTRSTGGPRRRAAGVSSQRERA